LQNTDTTLPEFWEKPMNIRFWLSGLLITTTTAIALGSVGTVRAQRPTVPSTQPGVETDLPTGNIRDLDGLEPREVNDWFPQNGISDGRSGTILEINQNSPPSTVVNPQLIGGQDEEWKNSTSGDPKQTGAGIPLGKF
jgi:hypothetical protein